MHANTNTTCIQQPAKKKTKKNWQTDGYPMGREWIQFSDRLNQSIGYSLNLLPTAA
jgi:hypothetical protein